MTVLKSTPIENFYAEISNEKFENARNWLKVIDSSLKLETKFFNGSFHIIIKLPEYCADTTQLECLKRECPSNLSQFIFFSKLELIENFYAEISNKKFGNARNWLKVIDSSLTLQTKFFNGAFYIRIHSCYWRDPKQLESLKRECPNNLSPFIFFSKLDYYTKLLENKNYQEIERTMAGCLSLYDPLMYHLYGLYNLEIGNLEKAMTYIFLSGIYTVETEHLANKFQTRFKNADRKQILGVMPNPIKLRSARSKLPSELKEKLREINIPEWLIR